MIAGMLILTAATLLYFVEGGVQPQAFGSIPRAMWWSVVTLTTVGYGDTAPITPVGRVLAALTCVGGIGLIAMPTGILAAAFSDAMRRKAEGEAAALLNDPGGAAGEGAPAGRRSGGTDPDHE
jgi:voltage-gated potassium channel